jgi:hypothetical protein
MKTSASSSPKSSSSYSNSPASSKGAAPKGAAPKGAAPKGAAPKGAAPKGAAPKGAAPKGAAPKGDCHLADSFQSPKLREELAKAANKHFTGYGAEVKTVNALAQMLNVNLSKCSAESIKRDLKAVEDGTMTWSEAHFKEAYGFREDFRQSMKHGNYYQATMEAAGAALNLIAGAGMSVLERNNKRSK